MAIYSDDTKRKLILKAYYFILNQQPDFLGDMEVLCHQLDQDLRPILSAMKKRFYSLTRGQRDMIAHRRQEENPGSSINTSSLKRKLKSDQVKAACECAATSLDLFCAKWVLPYAARGDLFDYYHRKHVEGKNEVELNCRDAGLESADGYVFVERIEIPALIYNPMNSRAQLDQQIKRIAHAIRGCADEIDNEVRSTGRKPLPAKWVIASQYRNLKVSEIPSEGIPADLKKAANVFFLRAVRKKTWGEIKRDLKCSRSAAFEQAKRFAEIIRVKLPPSA